MPLRRCGLGNDLLSGGLDNDVYKFGPSWGKDTITDSTTLDTLTFDVFSNGEYHPVSDNLTINLNPDDGPEVANARGTNTINWEGSLFKFVYPGSGDDQITGNYLSNEIAADDHGGADTISTRAGNDTVYVNDGSGDDVVDCGENLYSLDNDNVYFDSGDQIADNCENQNP